MPPALEPSVQTLSFVESAKPDGSSFLQCLPNAATSPPIQMLQPGQYIPGKSLSLAGKYGVVGINGIDLQIVTRGINCRFVPCGITYCRLGKKDALGIGMELDKRYHDKNLPSKFKMAVSGFHFSCSEFWVRDIGPQDVWQVVISVNVGTGLSIAQ